MEKKKIEQVVSRLAAKSGSSIYIQIEDAFPGRRCVGGKYNIASQTVTIYLEDIKHQCMNLFSSLDHFYDFFTIVLAHEIGHAEDNDLPGLSEILSSTRNEIERKKTALQIEENAWRYTEGLLDEVNTGILQTIIYHSLKPYKENIEPETA
ncbi:hypothetical protein IC621_04795 [Bacillus sp. IB182487]|uniref:Uncharacterized protein n=1 Tax=Metabacillus arenae TaxID=2771434 RepID=A0A926NDJ6_9BACI|nr:hypothetical protein [Metabacillus arenae]